MNILICGSGRAGKAMAEKVVLSEDHKLVGMICRKDSKNAGLDLGKVLYPNNDIFLDKEIIPIDDVPEKLKEKIDVVIDFSNRVNALPLIDLCGKIKSNLVICTTNHSVEDIANFKSKANDYGIGIVYCPNLTVGINLLMDFVAKIAKVLPNFDFEITECHPKDKGKPTATARMISQYINRSETPIHSIRMNGYVGIHEVICTDGVERITVKHESLSRQAFANGAILAAEFIKNKKSFFLMKDVISELAHKALD